MNAENDKPVPKYPSYRTEIPWDLTFAYSLTYNNNRRQRDFTNNSLMFSGNIELTPKWKLDFLLDMILKVKVLHIHNLDSIEI